jgi:hypothetical protein
MILSLHFAAAAKTTGNFAKRQQRICNLALLHISDLCCRYVSISDLCCCYVSICNFNCVAASVAISAARIVPSKIFAVVTASAAISAAEIVPSKSLQSLRHQLRYQRLESYRQNLCSRYSISDISG